MTKRFHNEVYKITFIFEINNRTSEEGSCYEDLEGIRIVIAPDETVGALAHEAVHAIDMLFDDRGIEREPLSEPYAYMVEWLVNKMFPIFYKHSKIYGKEKS